MDIVNGMMGVISVYEKEVTDKELKQRKAAPQPTRRHR